MKHVVWIIAVLVVAYFLFTKPYPSDVTILNQKFSDPADQNSSLNDLVLALYRSEETGDLFFLGESEDDAISSESLYERYQQIYAGQGYELRSEGDRTIGNNGKATIYLQRSSLYNGINSYVTVDADRPRELSEAGSIFRELASFNF